MSEYMDKEAALNLARIIANTHAPEGFDSLTSYLAHLSSVADTLGESIEKVHHNYPELAQLLRKDELVLSGTLHDIGRPLATTQLFHELRGARYMEEHGLEEGISDSEEAVYRIAQIMRPHGFVYEQFLHPANSEAKEEFRDTDPVLLVPRNWHEALVAYADFTTMNGDRCTVGERIEATRSKSETTMGYHTREILLDAMEKGLHRAKDLCHRTDMLVKGELPLIKVVQYGFL